MIKTHRNRRATLTIGGMDCEPKRYRAHEATAPVRNFGGPQIFVKLSGVRVVALLMVVCGCRVATSSSSSSSWGDAATPRGEGLPDRVITDVALWADLPAVDHGFDNVTRRDSGGDGSGDRPANEQGGVDGNASDVAGAGETCPLLGAACVGREGCYPLPFDRPPNGGTGCAFQGVGGPSVPCQSQLDCDGLTLCAAPDQPDSVCLQRCSLNNPRCPTGSDCQAYFGYSGVGVCR
ncbi:MAG: hypothetical protein ABIS92_17920 [Polyangia bacterium]